MAVGSHPFPFRTRKLSPPAPMVLGRRLPGRVGRRRISHEKPPLRWGLFCVFDAAVYRRRPMPAKPPSRKPSSGGSGARSSSSRDRPVGGGRSGRSSGPGRDGRDGRGGDSRRESDDDRVPRSWGGVARRGAAQVAPRSDRPGSGPPRGGPRRDDDRGRAARAWDDAGRPPDERVGSRHDEERPWEHTDLDPPEPEEWILEGIEQQAEGAVRRGNAGRGKRDESKKPLRDRPTKPASGAKSGKGARASVGEGPPADGSASFDKAVGTTRGARLEGRLKEASR